MIESWSRKQWLQVTKCLPYLYIAKIRRFLGKSKGWFPQMTSLHLHFMFQTFLQAQNQQA